MQALFQRGRQLGVAAGGDALGAFHGQGHVVQRPVVAGQLHMVFAAQFGEGADDVHDLAGIDVDAAVDDHVVGTAEDAVMAGHAEAAGTVAGQQAGKVVGAVAQQGHGLLAQAGDHHLAHFAFGHGLQGLGIEDLDDEQVGPVVQAVVLVAVDGRPGSWVSSVMV